jgi:hypothetical protein
MRETRLIRVERSPLDVLEKEAEEGRLFAILDACDSPWVPQFAEALGEENAVCLYRGEPEESLWAVAPYLIVVDPAILRWIPRFALPLDEGWGIFVVSTMPLGDVRRHFRRFLRVQGPDRAQFYLRFYDPRVLRWFLESCTDSDVASFMQTMVFATVDPTEPRMCTLIQQNAQPRKITIRRRFN